MNKKKITFIIPVCSRGQTWKTIQDAPIIRTFFDSVKKTLTDGDYETYNFHIDIGYDNDDAFFFQHSNTIKLFVESESAGKITLDHYAFDDTKHNPARCWNNLAKIAVVNGTDYLYQAGDDVEILTPGWVSKFVTALESTDNIGVAAPKDLGYYGLYTQSFVHKTHIEILGSYYPDVFKSWYSDDHTTGIYKPRWNHYIEDCHIKNTGGPQRYNADDAQPILVEAVARSQKKLYNYLADKYNPSDDDKKKIISDMRTVHIKYEEISKTMTTAKAKPFWSSATKIFDGIIHDVQ